MNLYQNALYRMMGSLSNVINDNSSVWEDNTQFTNAFEDLTTKMGHIAEQIDLQIIPTKGVTIEKHEKRDELETLIMQHVTAMEAYAGVTGNSNLRKTIHYTKSSLIKQTGKALIGVAELVIAKATTLVTALAPYGVTTGTIAALTAAQNTFTTLEDRPKTAIDTREKATALLARYIDEAMEVLEQRLDALARVVALANPDFGLAYTLAREIDDPAYRTLALRISVREGGSNLPVPDAEVLILPAGISRRTTALGNCLVRSLEEGMITVRISKYGYITQELDGAVNNGETTDLIVVLQRG